MTIIHTLAYRALNPVKFVLLSPQPLAYHAFPPIPYITQYANRLVLLNFTRTLLNVFHVLLRV